jgi:hypothetical protein
MQFSLCISIFGGFGLWHSACHNLSREARMATNPRFIPEKEKRIIRSDAASFFSPTNKVTLVASLSEHPTVRRFYKLNNASIAGEKFQRERKKTGRTETGA